MANPKRRHSNERTRTRRAHHALKPKTFVNCTQCAAPVLPHRICPKCGYYRGHPVMTVKAKKTKEKNQ